MEHKVLLQNYINLEEHNLYCYSANLLMTIPKEGYENNWQETKDRIAGLKHIQMLLDIQDINKEAAPSMDPKERDCLVKAINRNGLPLEVYIDTGEGKETAPALDQQERPSDDAGDGLKTKVTLDLGNLGELAIGGLLVDQIAKSLSYNPGTQTHKPLATSPE